MRTMLAITILAASLAGNTAWAYGGGGGGGSPSCTEPKFLEPNPTGPVAALTGFGFVATDTTLIETLTVEVNGQKVQPAITKRRSGDFEVKVTLPQPITQAGKARITAAAKGREGCAGFQPFYVEIKP